MNGTAISASRKTTVPISDSRLAHWMGSIEMPSMTGTPTTTHKIWRLKKYRSSYLKAAPESRWAAAGEAAATAMTPQPISAKTKVSSSLSMVQNQRPSPERSPRENGAVALRAVPMLQPGVRTSLMLQAPQSS